MRSQGLPRITLRMQLALLYAGFLTFGAALLLVPILTIHQAVPVLLPPPAPRAAWTSR